MKILYRASAYFFNFFTRRSVPLDMEGEGEWIELGLMKLMCREVMAEVYPTTIGFYYYIRRHCPSTSVRVGLGLRILTKSSGGLD